MVKKGKIKIKICVYCSQLKEVSKDHVVPKCLFTQPYPPNLISVPACDDCNREKSLNDDYLRDFLVTDNYVNQSPVAQQIFHQKMLSSQRQGSSVIAREAVSKARLEPLYTKGGIYMGDFHTVVVDAKRIETIFKTLVKGLYYNSQKKLFPDGYVFELRRHFPWDFQSVWAAMSKLTPRIRTLGNVFGCAFQKAEEDAFTTLWLFWFYERIAFSVSATHPQFIEDENTPKPPYS
jgi:hypothetical protein